MSTDYESEGWGFEFLRVYHSFSMSYRKWWLGWQIQHCHFFANFQEVLPTRLGDSASLASGAMGEPRRELRVGHGRDAGETTM